MNRELPADGAPIEAKATKFVAVGAAIMRGSQHIATAVSNTMARRIAAALNDHIPNRRGI